MPPSFPSSSTLHNKMAAALSDSHDVSVIPTIERDFTLENISFCCWFYSFCCCSCWCFPSSLSSHPLITNTTDWAFHMEYLSSSSSHPPIAYTIHWAFHMNYLSSSSFSMYFLLLIVGSELIFLKGVKVLDSHRNNRQQHKLQSPTAALSWHAIK